MLTLGAGGVAEDEETFGFRGFGASLAPSWVNINFPSGVSLTSNTGYSELAATGLSAKDGLGAWAGAWACVWPGLGAFEK